MNTHKKRIPELEGLRSIAALMVGIYHIWFERVSGGVDIFFVVSGFLITTSLYSMATNYQTIKPFLFLTKLLKRLLPVSLLVLFSVTVLSLFVMPQVQWGQAISEGFASLLYYQNWQLALTSTDYLAKNFEAGPFQHYWALAIQGQFYVLWTLLFLFAVTLLKRLTSFSLSTVLISMFSVIFIVSLSYSIMSTSANQVWAYYDTFARVWQFSLGGLAVFAVRVIRLPSAVSFAGSWLGLAMVVSTGILFQVSDSFPGFAALWPSLAATIIILTSVSPARYGANLLLSSRPLQYFGSISYAFYLWHWPVLIFYYVIFGQTSVSIVDGTLILLISWFLAHGTTYFAEKPFRSFSGIRSVITYALLIVTVFSALIFWHIEYQKAVSTTQESATEIEKSGALAIENGLYPSDIDLQSLSPNPAQAREDIPDVYPLGCHVRSGDEDLNPCSFGETDDPEFTIVLAGGSHSAHWLPALQKISEDEPVEIISHTKSGCRFSDETSGIEEDCIAWNEKLLPEIINIDPDLVFLTSDIALFPEIPDGYIRQWEALHTHDIDVFAIRDNPYWPFDPPTCVEEKGTLDDCSLPRDEVLTEPSQWQRQSSVPDNVHYFDSAPYFCDDDTCYPVIGNTLIYRDHSHLTTAYVKSMAPILKKELMGLID